MRVLLIVSVILLVLFGCITPSSSNAANPSVKQIKVTGTGIGQTVDYNGSVAISVTGTNNVVRVSNVSIVQSVEITGTNNVVFIPQGSHPTTSITGTNCRIEYY